MTYTITYKYKGVEANWDAGATRSLIIAIMVYLRLRISKATEITVRCSR